MLVTFFRMGLVGALMALLPLCLAGQPVPVKDPSTTTLVYSIKGKDTLALDLYRPIPDPLRNRYLVLYVHGGGFSGGWRDDNQSVQFAKQLTALGYTAASVSYRLTAKGKGFSCLRPAAEKLITFRDAAEDILDAVGFLLGYYQSQGVDSLRIVLAGSSAGAEAMLHAAYWPEALFGDPSTRLPAGFRFSGLISMAGALADTTQITRNNGIPALFFHGTADPLVPFGVASHHLCPPSNPGYLVLYGPEPITDRYTVLDHPFYSVEVRGGQHEWNHLPMHNEIPTIYDFLENDVLLGNWRQARIKLKTTP